MSLVKSKMWRVMTPATAGAAVGEDTNRLIKSE